MRPTRVLLATAVVALTLALTTGPAAAHGDEGALEVVSVEPTAAGDGVVATVALTYQGDGHPVDAVGVTATASLPGRAPLAPVTMGWTGAGGGYQATLFLPEAGTWTLTFTATEPAAETSTTYAFEPPPPTTAAPATSAAPTTSVTPEGGAELVEDDTDDDGPPTALVAGVVVAGVALTAGVVVALVRRRRDGDVDPGP